MNKLLILCTLFTLSQAGLLNRSKQDEHKEITLLKANKHSIVLRAPTSMSQFFRRVLGKEKSVSKKLFTISSLLFLFAEYFNV